MLLPISYTNMEDVALPKSEDYFVPSTSDITKQNPFPTCRKLPDFLKDETDWLEHVENTIEKGVLDDDDWISWAAYFASISTTPTNPCTKTYMMPLLTVSSNSPVTIFHCMKMIQLCTNKLNPGQTPVMSCDQPIYTIAKKLQWKYPDSVIGEDKFLCMIGGLHVEKMLWCVSGDWLDGSGWTTLVSNSGVSKSGTAESHIGASHICRTRYVHTVCCCNTYHATKSIH